MIATIDEKRDTAAWLKMQAVAPKRNLEFEFLPTRLGNASATLPLYRARVPAGWLVVSRASDSVAFIPDPSHKWDGGTVD